LCFAIKLIDSVVTIPTAGQSYSGPMAAL